MLYNFIKKKKARHPLRLYANQYAQDENNKND